MDVERSAPKGAVFLSYASQDAEAAKRICETLRAAGVEVWFDQNELVGGDAWDQKIRKQIKECTLLVPIISANTQSRTEGYFRLEWRLADQRTHLMAKGRPFLLPIVIDGTTDAEAQVPDSFTEVQWTKSPGGAVPPAFVERTKRLLAGETRPAVRASAEPEAGTGGGRKTTGKSGRIALIAGVVVAAGIGAFWGLRKAPPSAPIGPVATAPIGTAADETLRRVTAMLDKSDVTRAELDLAGQLLAQAVQADPANGLLFAAWARVDCRYFSENYDLSEGRKDAARKHVAQAVALAPDHFEVRYARAVSMKELAGSAAKAETLRAWQELAKDRPTDLNILLGLAWCHNDAQDPTAALAVLDRAEALGGSNGRTMFNRALVLLLNNRAAEAMPLFQKATEHDPAVTHLLWQSYQETIWLGRPDLARRTLARVPADYFLEDMPASARYFVEMRARDFEAALATMRAIPREFVQSNAGTFPTGYLRGRALKFLGRAAAAEAEWTAALAMVERRLVVNQNDREMLQSQAVLLAALGRREAAAKVWATVTELYRSSRGSWLSLYYAFEQSTPDELLQTLGRGQSLFFWLTAAELRLDPMFDHVRDDPRFAALLKEAEADPQRAPQPAKADPSLAPPAATNAPNDKSVAVLAFANLSDDKANEYFSDGISEELLNVLGRVPGLRVAAPMSAFSFKGRNVAAPEIGQKLNVAYLVSGSVRWSGSAIRVVARLSRAATDEQIWTDKFDGEAKNVFALQDEIAAKIATALSLKLGASSRGAQRIDPEAYRLYLEARHFWSLRSFGGFDRAEAALKQAIALDQASALLRAGLAEVYATRGWYRAQNAQDPGENYTLAAVEADRAVALDPDNAQAIVAQATIAIAQRRFADAERLLQQALALAPNDAAAFDRKGDLMVRMGRLDAAVENYQRAMQLDPLSIYLVRDVVRELAYARRFQDVIETVDRYEASAPRDWRTMVFRSQALLQVGKAEQAARELKGILPTITPDEFSSSGSTIAELVFSLRQAKCAPESEALARQLLERHRPGTYLHAMVLVAVGRAEEALPLLVAFPTGTEDRLYWSVVFDPVREDPRFLRKIEEFGVTAEYKVARETLARILKDHAAKK